MSTPLPPLEETVDYLQGFPNEKEGRQYFITPARNKREALIRIKAEQRRLQDGLSAEPPSETWTHPCTYWTASYYLSHFLLFGEGAANEVFQERFWNLYGTKEMQDSTWRSARVEHGCHKGRPLMSGIWHAKRLESWFKPGGRNLIALEELDYHMTRLGTSTVFLDPRGWCAPKPSTLMEAKLREIKHLPEDLVDDDEKLLQFLVMTTRTKTKLEHLVKNERARIASRYWRVREESALLRLRSDPGLLDISPNP